MYTTPMYAPVYGQPAQPVVVMPPGGAPVPVYYGGYPPGRYCHKGFMFCYVGVVVVF